MNPSQNKEKAHATILNSLLTYLRSMKMADQPDFRTAGAAIEAHLLQLDPHRRSSPQGSRLAESDAEDP